MTHGGGLRGRGGGLAVDIAAGRVVGALIATTAGGLATVVTFAARPALRVVVMTVRLGQGDGGQGER